MEENSKLNTNIKQKNLQKKKKKSLNLLNKGVQFTKRIIKHDLINNEIKKVRNPGIDLVRLFAMYCIVVNHFLYFGNGYNYFYRHKRILYMIHNFTDWHNDAFILISGIVGYKTNKYSNLLYLWLTVLFYSVGIHKYILEYKKGFQINHKFDEQYYPLIFKKYWYFTIYFGTYLYLPLLIKVSNI